MTDSTIIQLNYFRCNAVSTYCTQTALSHVACAMYLTENVIDKLI